MGAELKREDIISDEALEAPLILAKNMEIAYDVVMKIAKATKNMPMPDEGLKKTREETTKLTAEEKELEKVTKQLAATNAKNNEEYIKEAAALKVSKQALKEKTELGERDAKTVNAQNASVQVLTAALNKNRLAYKNLATEEKRTSKEGMELHKIIVQQDKDVKRLNASIGDHRDNVGNYADATKNLKMQLRGAHDEMVGIAQTLGTQSAEFVAAAAKAGELKNEIADMEASINALSGSKMENVANSFGLVGQKLKTLDFKGANAAAMQFFTIMKSMTFAEATAGMKAFGATMAKEGLKLLKNPYVLAAAAIIAAGAALNKLKDDSPGLSKAMDSMTGPLKAVTDWFKKLTDAIGLTTFALNEQNEATVNASKEQIAMIEKAAAREISVAAAKGEKTVDLEIQKNEAVKVEAAKGMQAIIDINTRYGKKMNEEQKKDWDDFVEVIADANTRITVINEEARTQERKDAATLNKFLLDEEIKTQQQIVDNEQNAIDDRINATIELEEKRRAMAKKERDEAKKDPNLSPSAKALIDEQYETAKTEITKQGIQDRQKITADAVKEYNDNVKKQIEKEKAAIIKAAEARTNSIDKDIEATKKAAIARGMSLDEAEKIIAEKRKRYADDYVQVQIDALKKVLAIENLSADERADVEKKLYKLKTDLTNAYYEQLTKEPQQIAKGIKSFIEEWKQGIFETMDAIGNVAAAFTERTLKNLDEESQRKQEQTDQLIENEDEVTENRLKNRNLDDEQRQQIEETSDERKRAIDESNEKRQNEIEARRKKAIRRQAIFEKSISLAKAGINLAEAIVAAMTITPPASFAAAALTAVIAGIQLAAIAATPIPAAAKGIQDHKGGPIIAGERGTELIKMPGGRYALTSAAATVYDLPRGTDIIPHEQTMAMLANASLHVDRQPMAGEPYSRIEKKLDRINTTIKNKREWNLTGRVTGYQDGGTRAKYIESLRNRPK